MKKLITAIILFIIPYLVFSQQTGDPTNDFYDNDSLYLLGIPGIVIDGEIANPGPFRAEGLQERTVLVKEVLQGPNGDTTFIGAYKYVGYSLYDILNTFEIKKNNFDEFNVITDLYVEVEGRDGEKVVLSWGEIFYPSDPHRVIIATGVMPVIPSKTKEVWPLPKSSKLVMGNDFLSLRNISNPVRITVKTPAQSFTVTRHMEDMYSPEVNIKVEGKDLQKLKSIPGGIQPLSCPTVFYGRGRGLHSMDVKEGYPLSKLVALWHGNEPLPYQTGLILIAGKDGYRAVFSLSEVCNRNDYKNFLFIDRKNDSKGGAFSVFTAPDFFSDRAVKAITDIIILK